MVRCSASGLLDEHEAVDAPRLLALELADHQQMAQAHHVRILEEVAKRRQHHLVYALGVHLLVRRRVVGDVEQDAALSEEPTRPLQRIAHDGVEYGLLAGKWLYSDASLMPTAAAMSRTDTAWKPRDANNANASSTMRSFVSFPRMVSPLQN